MKGYVSSIESMGLFDGPGIRCVVFLGGCPLRCKFCHNPEMWTTKHSTLYDVVDLYKKIERFKPYFKENGGVTFSGGEPLSQVEFLKEILKLCKENNINTCLDTSGVGKEYEELLDYIDLVILDIKDYRKDNYLELTGKKIDYFNEFLDTCIKKNKRLWLRQVIIPTINDNDEYIEGLKEYINNIPNVEKIELLPYHQMGIEKYKKLNINYSLKDIPEMNKDLCMKWEEFLNKK